MVITQLLEFAYKYSCDILSDALLYAQNCSRESISPKDVKLALQAKVGRHFLPTPSRDFLKECATTINNKPLSQPDPDNLLRVPGVNAGFYGTEYILEQQDSVNKRRRVH